jgi:hypothetical protein
MNQNEPHSVTAVGVGALAGAGSLLTHLEPILASLSYLAAIVVAVVTLYFKFRDRRK